MTKLARSSCRSPALAAALLAMFLLQGVASAQEQPRIEVVPQVPHAARVLSASFSPDGAQLVTGSQDGTVRLWDVATGRLVRTLGRHADREIVNQVVAFSPDGTRALSAIQGGGMKLWDVATGRLVRAIDASGTFYFNPLSVPVPFSPDGARVLAGLSDGKAAIWDIASGQQLQMFDHGDRSIAGSVSSVAFSPDGTKVLTVGGDHRAKLWDAATGKLVWSFASSIADVGNLSGHAVAFSPDGARVAVATANVVELRHAATGEVVRAMQAASGVRLMAFAKDGALLAGTGWGLEAEDIAKGQLETIFKQPIIALSADGRRVLASKRDVVTSLSLWDVKTWQQIRLVGHEQRLKLTSLAVSPDGDQLVAGGVAWPGALLRSQERGDPAVSLWDVAGGKLVHTRRLPDYEEIAKFAFSPEGAVVFSHDSLARLTQRSVATGKSLRTIDLGDNDVYPSTLMDVSADGARAVTLSEYAKRIVLWDVAATSVIRTFDVDTSVQAVVLSPDGTRIAAASQERKVRVWDAASSDLVQTFDVTPAKAPLRHHPVTALAFSPDGAVLGACQGQDDHKGVKLWDVARGQLLRAFDFRCAGSVTVSPDATHVLARDNVTIGMPEADLTLRLGDTASGRLVHNFDGEAAAFARDGRRVFTASYDGTIRVWDAKTGGLVATLLSAVPHDMRWRAKRDERHWLAITPEGFFGSSSEEFATEVLSIVRGLEVSAVDAAAYQVLHRPDLVRAKLAGDPDGRVETAAAELQIKLGTK